MSKKFVDKLIKATRDSGSAFFTKKNMPQKQEDIVKVEDSMKEKGISMKDRMVNAAKLINENTLKGFQKMKKNNKEEEEDKTKERLDEPYDKLKGMRKISWNSLKYNKLDKLKLSSYINKAVSEVNDKLKRFKDKDEQSKQRTLQKSTSIQAWKQSIKQAIKVKGTKQQQKKSESWFGSQMHIVSAQLMKIKKMVERQSNNAKGFRLDFLSSLLEKMYWRFAFLLMLIIFAYGVGTSLPRQVRKFMQNDRKEVGRMKKEQETWKKEQEILKKETESRGVFEPIRNFLKKI